MSSFTDPSYSFSGGAIAATTKMSDAEKLNLVLKKVMGVPNTKPSDLNSLNQELPRPSRAAVFADQVYIQAIPRDADASGGVLTYATFRFTEDTAFAPAGETSTDAAVKGRRFVSAQYPYIAFYQNLRTESVNFSDQAFASTYLSGAIPGTLANAYTPVVRNVTAATSINAVTDPWLLDGDAGIVTFFDNVAAATINKTNPPRVTFFRYEGTRGLGSALESWTQTADALYYAGRTGVAVGKTSVTENTALDVSGNIRASNVYATRLVTLSDGRFKQDVEPLAPGVLGRVLQLSACRYRLKANPLAECEDAAAARMPEIGLIAGAVQPLFPELVVESEAGYQMLMYDRLPVVLLQAMQEQQGLIQALREEVAALRTPQV